MESNLNALLILGAVMFGLYLLSLCERVFVNKWTQRILLGIAFILVVWLSAETPR